MFHLSLYQEGRTSPDSNSHYFNIKAKSLEGPSTSISTLASTTTPSTGPVVPSVTSPLTTASTLSYGKPTVTSSSNNQSSQSPNSSYKFPTEAKIGLGVGIPIALALGLAAEYFFLRQRRKKHKSPKLMMESPNCMEHDQRYHSSGIYGSNLNEAPPKSPVELDSDGPKHTA